jgi:hypothetical protein
MSEDNPIRIFVVHAFAEHPDYLRIFEYLECRPNFFYRNCSNPTALPQGALREDIRKELRQQINSSEVVIVPVSLFVSDPVLTAFQVDTAKLLKKPVLAIKSFGDTQAVKRSVLDGADDVVEWNDRAIADAVRRLARNDKAGEWEDIEFKID